jgi:hypothetical protein
MALFVAASLRRIWKNLEKANELSSSGIIGITDKTVQQWRTRSRQSLRD